MPVSSHSPLLVVPQPLATTSLLSVYGFIEAVFYLYVTNSYAKRQEYIVSQPSIFMGSVSSDSTNHRLKVCGGKKIPESSKMQSLNFPCTQQLST